MTPEQIAAAAKVKELRLAENAKKIKAGGDGAMIALLDNVASEMTEKIAGVEERNTGLRTELTAIKADVEKAISMGKSRNAGKSTDGMDTDKFRFSKLLKAYQTHGSNLEAADTSDGIGYELEVLTAAGKGYGTQYTKKEVVSTLTGQAGGFPMPVQIRSMIVEAARSTSALFQMGIHSEVIEGMSSFSVPMERTDTGGIGNGVIMDPSPTQELGAIKVTRNGYALANFTPRKLAMIVGITNDLIRQGGDFVETFIREMAARDMRNQLERYIISGAGQNQGQPTGILNRTDLTPSTIDPAIGTNGRAAVLSDLKAFEFALMGANRFVDDAKYLTHPLVMRGVSSQYTVLASGGTAYPTFPSLQLANIKKFFEIVGFDIRQTTNVPSNLVQGSLTTASAIMYGDWSRVWVPMWGPMEFLMTNIATVAGTSAFESDMSWMRFVQMYDANIVAPDAMIAQSGFFTTGFTN